MSPIFLRPALRGAVNRGGAVMRRKMIASVVAGVFMGCTVIRNHCMLAMMALIVVGELVDLIRSGNMVSLLGFIAAIIGMVASIYQTWKSGDRKALLRVISDLRVGLEHSKSVADEMRGRIDQNDVARKKATRERALIELQVAQMSKEYLTEHGILLAGGKVFRLKPFSKPPRDTDVLVVEDHPATRVAMGKLLRYYGFGVDEAADVKTATDMLRVARDRADPYDFVLLDMGFPGGTGDQGIDLLRTIREGPTETRAIVISGSADAETIAAAERNGAVAVLSKPVDKANLFGLMGLHEELREDLE